MRYQSTIFEKTKEENAGARSVVKSALNELNKIQTGALRATRKRSLCADSQELMALLICPTCRLGHTRGIDDAQRGRAAAPRMSWVARPSRLAASARSFAAKPE